MDVTYDKIYDDVSILSFDVSDWFSHYLIKKILFFLISYCNYQNFNKIENENKICDKRYIIRYYLEKYEKLSDIS